MRKLIVLYILLLNLFLMRDVLSISPICNEGNLSRVNKKNEKFMKDMSCLNDTKLKLKYGEKRYQDAQNIIMDGHMLAIQNLAWSMLMDTMSSVETLSVGLNKDALFSYDRTNSFYKEGTGQKHGCDFNAPFKVLKDKCGETWFLEDTFKKINDFKNDTPDKNQCQSPLKAVKNHAIKMSLQTDVTSQSLNDLFTGEGWRIFEKAIKEGEKYNKSPLQVLSNMELLYKLQDSVDVNLIKIFKRVSSTPLLKQAFMSKDSFFDLKNKFTDKFSKGNKDPLRYILKMDNGLLKKAVRNEINQCVKVINYFESVACNMKKEDFAGYSTSENINSRFIGKSKNKNIRLIKKLKDSCVNLERPPSHNYVEQAISLGTNNLLFPYKKTVAEREEIQAKYNEATCSLTKKICKKVKNLEVCEKEDLFSAFINSGCVDRENVKNQGKPICQSKLAKRNYEHLKDRKSDFYGPRSIREQRKQDDREGRIVRDAHIEGDLPDSIYKFSNDENSSKNKYTGVTIGRNKKVETNAASFYPQDKGDSGVQKKSVNSRATTEVSENEESQGYGENRLFSGYDEHFNYLGENQRGYQAQIDYNNNKLNDPESTEKDKLKKNREDAIAKALDRIQELEEKMKEIQKKKEELEANKLERERAQEKEKLKKEEQEARDKVAKMIQEANQRKLERERSARLKAEKNARSKQEELDRRNIENNNPVDINPFRRINNPLIVSNNQITGKNAFREQDNINPVSQTSNKNTADQSLNNKVVKPKDDMSDTKSTSSVVAGESSSVTPKRHSLSGLSLLLGGSNITPSMPEWNNQIDEIKKDKSIQPSEKFRVKKTIDFSKYGITDPKEAIKTISGESKAMKGIFAAKGGGFNLVECTYAPTNKDRSSLSDLSSEEMNILRQTAFMNTKQYKKNKQVKEVSNIVKKTKCKVIQHAKDKNAFPGEVMTNQEVMEEAARNSKY